MTVYIDIMFLREFIFDALLLSITAWLMKMKWVWWKIGLASCVGALYTIALFFPQLSFLFHFSFKLAISIIMLFITFGASSWTSFFKQMAAFYLLSFLAGGVTTGLYYLFLPTASAFWKNVLLMNDSVYTVIQTSFIYVLVALAVAILLITKMVASKKMQRLIDNNIVNVTITIQNTHFQCLALIDTGNQLYDPLTRTPVVIIEASLLEQDFPDLIAALQIRDNSAFIFSALSDELLSKWQTKIKLVPFRSVNKDGQFMVALKPDQLSFVHHEKSITTSKVLLGLDYGVLSSERKYAAIMHPALIEVE